MEQTVASGRWALGAFQSVPGRSDSGEKTCGHSQPVFAGVLGCSSCETYRRITQSQESIEWHHLASCSSLAVLRRFGSKVKPIPDAELTLKYKVVDDGLLLFRQISGCVF